MDIVSLLVSALIGIPIGIACSLIAWWLIFHRVVPDLKFSEHISKAKDERNNGRPTYRVKFKNCGRRGIVDVQLFARVYVKGLNPQSPCTRRVVLIPFRIAHWPKLDIKGGAKLTALLPEKAVALTESWYPQPVREKATNGTLTLEDILAMGVSAQLEVAAFAYDAYSGTRKVFISKYYTTADVKEGLFEMEDSLDIAPLAP